MWQQLLTAVVLIIAFILFLWLFDSLGENNMKKENIQKVIKALESCEQYEIYVDYGSYADVQQFDGDLIEEAIKIMNGELNETN